SDPAVILDRTSDADEGSEASAPFLRLTLAGVLSGGPGGLDPAFQVDVRAYLRAVSCLEIWVGARIPTFPTTLELEAGRINWFSTSFGGGLAAHLLPTESAVDLHVGVHGQALFVRAWGEADDPRKGRVATQWSALTGLHVGLDWWFASALALTTELQVSAALPSVRLEAAGQNVARWGLPVVTASVGMSVALD